MRGAQVQYGKAHRSHFSLRRGSAPLVYMIITTIMITTNTAVIFHETNAANITMIILITRFYNALRATVLR